MATENSIKPGSIVWQDLTIKNADQVSKFYEKVAGWTRSVHSEECRDFNMTPAGGGDAVAGICYAEGPNSNMPAQWLLYVAVSDVDASAKATVEEGGRVLDGPRVMGEHRFAVIEDPAGAAMALIGTTPHVEENEAE